MIERSYGGGSGAWTGVKKPTVKPSWNTPETAATKAAQDRTKLQSTNRPSQNQGWKTATTHTGTEVYYDPNEERWEFGRGSAVGKAGLAHILGQQPQTQTPTYVAPPSGNKGVPTTGVSGSATTQAAPTPTPTTPTPSIAEDWVPNWAKIPNRPSGAYAANEWDREYGSQGMQAGQLKPSVTDEQGNFHSPYVDKQRNELVEWAQSRPMADSWAGEGLPMPEEGMYNKLQYTNWLKEEHPDAWDAWQPHKGRNSYTYNPTTGVEDGYSYDPYGNRGAALEPGAVVDRSRGAISQIPLGGESAAQRQAELPYWREATPEQQWRDAAPQQQPQQPQQQSMAQQYGWGAGLGGQQQQPHAAVGPTPTADAPACNNGANRSMPQQSMGRRPAVGRCSQWGQPAAGMGANAPMGRRTTATGDAKLGPDFMGQQQMGGPMAGMEAARMGGGAMQQMGGGSPWGSMWGDPFAGRQMTTDPNSPAMGGLPQMDPTQQLMMQMHGHGGGGLSGGFGAGGGSSGGGMSGGGEGAYQTPQSGGGGAGQAGGMRLRRLSCFHPRSLCRRRLRRRRWRRRWRQLQSDVRRSAEERAVLRRPHGRGRLTCLGTVRASSGATVTSTPAPSCGRPHMPPTATSALTTTTTMMRTLPRA